MSSQTDVRPPEPERMGRLAVKNKAAAAVQITAEQLLREAAQLQSDAVRPPKQRMVDEDEINEYRIRKRKEYEDVLRRKRHNMSVWMQYATWEAEQQQFRNARSVFERALEIDYENHQIWAKYIEIETKNKFINSARNLYVRVTSLLPRVDRFWFNYAHFEELLNNYAGARAVYERWIEWNPELKGWMLFVKFEERCGEVDRARIVFEKLLGARPEQQTFLKYSQFEESHKCYDRARAGFEKAIEILPKEQLNEQFFIKFAEFEERRRELERAKLLFEGAIQLLGLQQCGNLYKKYLSFQKRYAERSEVELIVAAKRRLYYQQCIQDNEYDYTTWIDYIRLEQSMGSPDAVVKAFEESIKRVPVLPEQRFWDTYMYLWYMYAIYEELDNEKENEDEAQDLKVKEVYRRALDVVPHSAVHFPRLWIMAAEYEIRKLRVDSARKIMGEAIAKCPQDEVFQSYCRMEMELKEIDRSRKICAKYIELKPLTPKAWLSLIDLELLMQEYGRARALFEMALKIEEMEQPEIVWKSYIDMETNLGRLDEAEELFNRLIELTHHWKVYRGLAEFEYGIRHSIADARKAFTAGVENCKERALDEERSILLETWLRMEKKHGDSEGIQSVAKMQPTKIRKRRIVTADDGSGDQWTEEYTAFIFPDSGKSAQKIAILEAAKKWKQRKLDSQRESSLDSGVKVQNEEQSSSSAKK